VAIAALIAFVSSVEPFPVAPKFVTTTAPGGGPEEEMTIENFLEAVFAGTEESITSAVIEEFVADVGVPEMAPEEVFRVKPPGRAPAVMLH